MPRLSRCLLTVVLLAGAFLAQAEPPSKPKPGPNLVTPGRVVLKINPTSAMTRFDPAVHGFRFVNSFTNNVIPAFDYRTGGLCGGMVFSALDYFHSGTVPIPTQPYMPGEGSPLRRYLYDRQVNSLVDHNHSKWVELSVNPGGLRNSEFFNWGFEGRLDELKRRIQRGEPVPLGLKGCDEGCVGDHQVLAIGYDVGHWTPAADKHDRGQVKIFLYDPNNPGGKVTLAADPVREVFYLVGDRNSRWRTWFISEYSKRPPPRISRPTREVVVALRTGGDDLRGGNDNVHLVLLGQGGREFRVDNANHKHRWVNNSTQVVSVALPDDFASDQLRGLRLETTFGGGLGGDNWNLDWIEASYMGPEGTRTLLPKHSATPLVRFSGRKREEFLF